MRSLPDSDTLGSRYYLYRMFHRIFADEPTAEALDAIDAPLAGEAFDMLEGFQDANGFEQFCQALEWAQDRLDAVHTDYMHLFVGPAALKAAPWESVYRDAQRLLMTGTTLDVRKTMRAHGFNVQANENVPEDHIALELDYLALLAQEALETQQRSENDACRAALEASSQFLEEHLGAWVGDFASTVRENADTPLYVSASQLVSAFDAWDKAHLQRILAG